MSQSKLFTFGFKCEKKDEKDKNDRPNHKTDISVERPEASSIHIGESDNSSSSNPDSQTISNTVQENSSDTAISSAETAEDGPKQPITAFPRNSDGRRFNSNWYSRFKWLEYSVEKNAAFCYACTKYAKCEGLKKEVTFTVTGYRNWKRAVGDRNKGLEQHDTCPTHMHAMASWLEAQKRQERGKTVFEMATVDVINRRKYYVKSIVEVIKFITINELALHGDYDKESHEEGGLFTSLVEYTMMKDSKLNEIAKTMPRNARYTSPEIQNSIIDGLANMVTKSVARDAMSSDADCFTLFADGTRDKSKVENISVALRYVKEGKAYEHLLLMPSLEKLDASSMATLLIEILESCGTNPNKMVSQCYDGASCISGDRGGVQRLIQERLNKDIPYVHCFNHRLHLVVIDLLKNLYDLRLFYDQLQAIYNFFRKFKADAVYKGKNLKRVIDTRWSGHFDSTCAVINNFSEIIEALDYIAHSNDEFDGETIVTAKGLYSTIREDKFKVCCLMMKSILGILKPADNALQHRETDITAAMNLINVVVHQLKSRRSDDKYEKIWEKAMELEELGEDVDVRLPKRQKVVSTRLIGYVVMQSTGNASSTTSKSTLKMLYFEAIDIVLAEMKRRFTDNSWLYLALSAMSMKQPTFLDINTLQPLKRLGMKIPGESELTVCKSFLQRVLPDENRDSNSVLLKLYEQRLAFPSVYQLAATIATFGSSTAVCESSFSTLSRIERPQRRSMTHLRQRNLVLLAFEKTRTSSIDIDDFVRKFAQDHQRCFL